MRSPLATNSAFATAGATAAPPPSPTPPHTPPEDTSSPPIGGLSPTLTSRQSPKPQAVVERIALRGVGELVDEAFAHEGILRMSRAAPVADRHGARTHGVLDAQVRDRIRLVGERRGGVDILQRGRGDAALQRHRIARLVEPRLQPGEARGTVLVV